MLRFDADIAECGLADAARATQKDYVQDVRVYSEHALCPDLVPDGPLLVLSNHPGSTDTLALFAALNRPNLKIIALDRPFLHTLSNMSKQLFFVQEETAARMSLVRQVSSYLRGGGAVLTFPAGHIEPDPDVYPGAVESLQTWTESASIFVRMAPQTAVLPVVVRGVIWAKAAHHPLLHLKRTRQEKESLAIALQFLAQVGLTLKPITARIQIGRPIYARDLGTAEPSAVHQAVLMEMQRLIECPPEGEGVSVL